MNPAETLYHTLLTAWNHHDAKAMAALCAPDCSFVGFDGSQMNGQAEIQATLEGVFASHQTGAFVSIIREVRPLSPTTTLLRAIVGMIPAGLSAGASAKAGKTELEPALNAIQSLVAVKQGPDWRIALFQNTPAALHGRPELVEEMTEELRKVV